MVKLVGGSAGGLPVGGEESPNLKPLRSLPLASLTVTASPTRTARMNGTRGTDHGTATVAFVAGGGVAGGRVRGDWPGLAPAQLFEARDLAPTTDLYAVAKGVLGPHLGLPPAALARVFPGSLGVAPMSGVMRG